MTEQEAKTLASELEHHRDWRVSMVYESNIAPGSWVVFLVHRRKITAICLVDTNLTMMRNQLDYLDKTSPLAS